MRHARAEQRLADGSSVAAPTPVGVSTAPAPVADPAPSPATYEARFASLDEASQALVTQHLTGLKTALQAERTTVKKLEGQVKAAQTLTEEKTRLETDLVTLTRTPMSQSDPSSSSHSNQSQQSSGVSQRVALSNRKICIVYLPPLRHWYALAMADTQFRSATAVR